VVWVGIGKKSQQARFGSPLPPKIRNFSENIREETMLDLTNEQIATLNEFGEAEAQTNYFLCAPAEFSRPFRLEVKRIGSIWVTMIPALDHPLFNRIMGLGVGQPATETLIDEAIDVLRKAGCKNYLVQVSPFAQPAQCTEWLASRGFKPGRNWAKVYRGNEPAPTIPTDLRVENIEKELADAYADVVLPVFEMPAALRPLVKGNVGQTGWHHYLAFDGKKPVAAAAMFVNGETAWLGFGSTLKKYRKRGGQGAMFARRIQDGLALGCKWFVTETGEDTPKDPNPSYHNMLRSGFKLAYLRRNYVHQLAAGPLEFARRALLVVEYGLRFELQHLRQR
jgi:hypothetical protein